MLCVPSARHVFGTASLASSALSASAELLVIITDTYFRTQLDVRFRNPKTSGTYADVLISIDSVVVTIDGRYSL